MSEPNRVVRRVAIVTDPALPGLQPDDTGLPAAFAARGVEIEAVPWGSELSPGQFDLVLVRTPWEYFLRPEAFLAWIEGLEVPVVNAPAVLRWNHDKRYLLELRERGAARLPGTMEVRVHDRRASADVHLDQVEADRAVLKPVVSGGAYRTLVIERGDTVEWAELGEGDFLVQEFVEEVATRGEWSLTFFAGEYSHAVRKTAREGDFRVQEEHGGDVHMEVAGERLVQEARRVLAGVPFEGALAYARVDLVERGEGRPLLMELELIEPELFLRAESGAVERLVEAVLAGGERTYGTA